MCQSFYTNDFKPCEMKKNLLKQLFVFIIAIGTSNGMFGQYDLVINEFMASNKTTLQDEDGDYSDWIEIKNTGTLQISLKDWYLTDDVTDFKKWAFPDTTIEAGEIIVVFASGKNRNFKLDKLHTNFKLSASGEFLALIKPEGIPQYTTIFTPAFLEQFTDISYGVLNGNYVYFGTPTPGAENIESTFITPPDFSVSHGFFDSQFSLTISSNISGAEIYYTTDASTPSELNGTKYSAPITITTTTVVRAIAVKSGVGTSASKTQTYIFPEDVLNQPADPPGYPEEWLAPENDTNIWYPWPSDYAMSSTIINEATIKPAIIKALKELPVVSIVSDIDNFFSKSMDPDTGGIYMYTGESDGSTSSLLYHLGRDWERPGSVEYFNSSKGDFQANCGLKLHGGASRTRRKNSKHSFKIGFKAEYGSSKLKEKIFGKGSPDQFDWLILRGGFGTRYGQQLRDPYGKETYKDMGQYSAYNQFVHVYLNGLYWGMYNLSEQMDENCMRDNLGGSSDDYDVLKDYLEVEAGDTLAWSNLITLSKDSIFKNDKYMKLLGKNPDGTVNPGYDILLNPKSLIDYIIFNYYVGNTDWDHHNWFAARRKTNSEGFIFMPWDLEYTLSSNTGANSTNIYNDNRPTGLFYTLMQNEMFRNLFVQRVNTHFFNDGALTPEPCLERYENLLAVIDTPIICESARWNVNETKSDPWEKSYNNFRSSYFPIRTELVFNQIINAGLYPSLNAPEFNTSNNTLPEDFELFLSAPEGDIYYTIDGTDPGYLQSGSSSLLFYNGNAIPLSPGIITIKARAKKDTIWSAVTSQLFEIEGPSSIQPLFTNGQDTYFYSYPNPASDIANITFYLNHDSEISLKIYNITGKLITTLENGRLAGGDKSVPLTL